MRKKYLIGGGVILGAALIVSAVLYCRSSLAGANDKIVDKNSKNMENARDKVWDKDDYLIQDEPESKVDNVATKVETDPTSKLCLVNKEYYAPADYVPNDLVIPNVKFSFDYADEKRHMREEAAEALEKLFSGAAYYGFELYATSGYRSYGRQTMLYEYNLLEKGYEYTNVYSARPGRSEHQLGFSMDITSKSVNKKLTADFGDTDDGKWINENCHKYGFVVRYPKGKEDVTGYAYEPWHLRYVGYDLSKYLYDNNMTLDEYYGYRPNNNNIDREQMAYYDNLLSKGSKKKQEITQHASSAELDDVDVIVDPPVTDTPGEYGGVTITAPPSWTSSPSSGNSTPHPWEKKPTSAPLWTAAPTARPTVRPATVRPATVRPDTARPVITVAPTTEKPEEPTDSPVVATDPPVEPEEPGADE